MSLNKVFLMGRLVRDPEVSYGSSMAVCRFTVAVDDVKRKGEEKAETNFIPCKAFGKVAEVVGNYFAKGNRIVISDGRIKVESYTDKTGAKKTSFGVIVNGVEFVENKGGSGSNKPSAFAGMGTVVSGGEEVPF